jgi:hypothetical protein
MGNKAVTKNTCKLDFETENYIGSDIAQFGPGRERPSRSAKLVASLQWPERISSYLLTTNRARSEAGAFGNKVTIQIAVEPCIFGSRSELRIAASRRRLQQSDCCLKLGVVSEQWGTVLSPACVEHEGLLTLQDIRRVEDEIVKRPPVKPDKTEEIAVSEPRWVMYNLTPPAMKAAGLTVPPTLPYPPGTQQGPPENFGWLRRSDLEHEHPEHEIWEIPTGELYPHKKSRGRIWLIKFPVLPKTEG